MLVLKASILREVLWFTCIFFFLLVCKGRQPLKNVSGFLKSFLNTAFFEREAFLPEKANSLQVALILRDTIFPRQDYLPWKNIHCSSITNTSKQMRSCILLHELMFHETVQNVQSIYFWKTSGTVLSHISIYHTENHHTFYWDHTIHRMKWIYLYHNAGSWSVSHKMLDVV